MEGEIVSEVAKEVRAKGERKKCGIGIFSILLLCGIVFSIYNWFTLLEKYRQNHVIQSWDHYHIRQISLFQQTILRYKIYYIPVMNYLEPNILLALSILLTFPMLISLERQTCTLIMVFQYNGIGIYLQLLRLALDGFQYLLTGRCYCLNGGVGAVWINMLTKFVYYRFGQFMGRRVYLIPLGVFLGVSAVMLVWRARVDLFFGVAIAVLEVLTMGGGVVKFPKHQFYSKEAWAARLRVSNWGIWYPFKWNDYRENQLMCLSNDQFYVSRRERIALMGGSGSALK